MLIHSVPTLNVKLTKALISHLLQNLHCHLQFSLKQVSTRFASPMSLSTAAKTPDNESDDESMIWRPAKATGIFALPKSHVPLPLELTDSSPADSLDVAIGRFPLPGTSNGARLCPHSTPKGSHPCPPGTPKDSCLRPLGKSNGSHHGFNASPRTAVPAKFMQQHSAVNVHEVMAGMFSALQQNHMICQNLLTTCQQLLLAQGFSNQRCPGAGHLSDSTSPSQGLVTPSPGVNNVGPRICGNHNQGMVSPLQAVNNVGPHLCGNQHQGLVSPSSANHKTVLQEDDLLKEPSLLESPKSPHCLSPSVAETASQSGTKKKTGKRSSGAKRKRLEFDTMPHKEFPDSDRALVWLENLHHPTFLVQCTHKNKKHKVVTCKCRAKCDGRCRAQMKVPVDDASKQKPTELRIHVEDNCPCMDQRQTSNGSKPAKRVVPSETRTITRQVCKDNPHDKPESIFRKVFKVIEQTPHLRHYVPPEEHEKLRKQVKNLIPSVKNELMGSDFLFLRMDKVTDLKRLRDLHPFKLPSEQLDLPESVEEASDLLFARKPKCIKVNVSDLDPDDDPELVRHKLLTVLDGERDAHDGDPLSNAETRLHDRIKHLAQRDNVDNPWSKLLCYTSLALLWNLKDCAKLDFKVMGAADGTHGTTASGEKLLVFGCFDVKCKTNVRTFRPFIHAVSPVENELYFSMMVVTLLKYA